MIANAVATLIAAKMCLVFIVDLLLTAAPSRGLHPLIRAALRVSSLAVQFFSRRLFRCARLASIGGVIGSYQPEAICQIPARRPQVDRASSQRFDCRIAAAQCGCG